MRSILLQLHIGKPVRCNSWSNAPVAHGVQLTVYAEKLPRAAQHACTRTHGAIERELARLSAYPGPAPCVVKGNQTYPAYACAGAAAGCAGRVLIFVADGSGAIDPAISLISASRAPWWCPL